MGEAAMILDFGLMRCLFLVFGILGQAVGTDLSESCSSDSGCEESALTQLARRQNVSQAQPQFFSSHDSFLENWASLVLGDCCSMFPDYAPKLEQYEREIKDFLIKGIYPPAGHPIYSEKTPVVWKPADEEDPEEEEDFEESEGSDDGGLDQEDESEEDDDEAYNEVDLLEVAFLMFDVMGLKPPKSGKGPSKTVLKKYLDDPTALQKVWTHWKKLRVNRPARDNANDAWKGAKVLWDEGVLEDMFEAAIEGIGWFQFGVMLTQFAAQVGLMFVTGGAATVIKIALLIPAAIDLWNAFTDVNSNCL
ncbi:unnamed protein product [Symbiodinium sp. CCMP2456]|nr:unnamed protein product [Symbiodinium sp. CCMP2456]